jgi:hypothetical protein
VPVVAQCPNHCGAFFNVAVDLHPPHDPTVLRLPDNCWKCGHTLQEYETIRDLIAKARYYRETATPGGAA